MDVTMKIATNKDPATVHVSGSMNFRSAEGLNRFVDTIKVAQAWLKKQHKNSSKEPE
jgi:hypothetical protein